MTDSSKNAISKNVNLLAHFDIPGGGQVEVRDGLAIIGHIDPPHGTSLVDVSDPRSPRLLSKINLDGMASHSHKARFAGDRDLMLVNSEMYNRHFLRKGFEIPRLKAEALARDGREPTDEELAVLLRAPLERMADLHGIAEHGYQDGGFKVYDISDPTAPELLAFQHTGGVGVHRFDCDADYAYISSEMDGYVGNIVVIYDIKDPSNIQEVSRWHMPGQHVANGETPDWSGVQNRVHHGLRVGDELWVGCWHAGFKVVDLADINHPRTIAEHNYHPPFPEPTHTVLPVTHDVGGRRVAICVDEEHPHATGQPHAFLWVFDVTDYDNIQPLSTFHVTDFDAPWARAHLDGDGQYSQQDPEVYGPGAHQFQEHMRDNLVYCSWFSAGLQIIDITDPLKPTERGYYIPQPADGFPAPQSNDVDVDKNGIIYLIDRVNGLDILELAD
jgi:hypothetical protein